MANRYWVGNANTWDSSNTANWSTVSGGPGGASVPGAADAVFFDAYSAYSQEHYVTLSYSPTVLSINFTGFFGTLQFNAGTSISVAGTGTVFTGSTSMGVIGTPIVNVTNATATATTITPGAVTEFNPFSFNFTAGTYSLTLTAGSYKNLNFTGFSGTLVNTAISVYGNVTLSTGMTITAGSSAWSFVGTYVSSLRQITTNGKTVNFPVTINTSGGTTTLMGALTISAAYTLTLTAGNFNTGGYSVTSGLFNFAGGYCINTSTTFTASGTAAVWTRTNTTFAALPNILLSDASTTSRTFAAGTAQYGTLTIGPVGGTNTGTTVFTGSSYFNTISLGRTVAHTIQFTAGTVTTLNTWSIAGTAGNIVTISGVTAATYTLDILTRASTAAYLSVTNMIARATPLYCGTTSTVTTCTNVFALAYVAPFTHYWVGGSGTWNTTSTTNWSAASGGSSGAAVPFLDEPVVFDANSGATKTVTMTGALYCGGITTAVSGWTFATGTAPTIAIGGDVTFTATTTWSSTGGITFQTASANTQTITLNGTVLSAAVTFSGFGTFQLGSAFALSGANGITFTSGTFNSSASNYAITAASFTSNSLVFHPTVTLNASTFTLSAVTPVTRTTGLSTVFNWGTSTLVMTAATTFNGNGLTYGNVTFFSGSATTCTINGINTFGTFTVNNPLVAGYNSIAFAQNQTIASLQVPGGSGNRRVFMYTSTANIRYSLTVSASSLTDVDFRDLYIVGSLSGTRVGNRGNCTNITFSTPKTVYWNLAGAQNWSATGWSDTAAGAPSTVYFPLPQDTATFTNSGSVTGTITLDTTWGWIGTIDMSARTSAMTLGIANATVVYGSWTNGSGTAFSGTAALTFSPVGTQTLTGAGKTFASTITVDNITGTLQLGGALTMSTILTLTNGTFTTNGYAVTCSSIASTNSNYRTFNWGASTITTTGGSVDFSTSTGLVLNAGTSTLSITTNSTTMNGGGMTFYNVSMTNTAITYSLTGINTFNNLSFSTITAGTIGTITLSANQTISGTLTIGPSGADPTIRYFVSSDTTGTTRTLTCAAYSGNDVDFQDITIAGAAAPISATRLGDCAGNSGITFPSPKTVYWNLAGSQNWSATGWATSSGGVPAAANFPLAQDTVVFDNTGSAGSVTINASWKIGTFNASARTSAMTLTASSSNTLFVLGDWTMGTGVTTSGSGGIVLAKRGNQNLTSSGTTLGFSINVNSFSGTVLLNDALTCTSTLTFSSGTFKAQSYNATVSAVLSATTGSKNWYMGSGLWTVTGATTVIDFTFGSTNIYKETANILFENNTNSTNRVVSLAAGASYAFNKFTIGGATATGTSFSINNNNFSRTTVYMTEFASTKTVAHTVGLQNVYSGNYTTFRIGVWSVTGSVGNVVTFTTQVYSSSYNPIIEIWGDSVSGVNYLNFAAGPWGGSILFSGPYAVFYAGANSTQNTTNGFTLTAAPTPRTLYWVGGTGNWSDTTHWSLSSGGAGGNAAPTTFDTVIFDTSSSTAGAAYTLTFNLATTRAGATTFGRPSPSTVLTFAGSTTFAAFRSLNFSGGSTGLSSFGNSLAFCGGATGQTFNANGAVGQVAFNVYAMGGEWTMTSAWVASTFGLYAGTFNTNGYAFRSSDIRADNSIATRKLMLGASAWTYQPGSGQGFYSNSFNFTLDAGTSTYSPVSSGGIFYTGLDNVTFYNVVPSGDGLSLGTNVTVNNLVSGGYFPTYFFGDNLTINGTLPSGSAVNSRVMLRGSSELVASRINCISAQVLSNIDLKNVNSIGANIGGASIGDGTNNYGNITFTAPKTIYLNGGAGRTYLVDAWYATSSGGVGSTANYPLPQDTLIIDNNTTFTNPYYLGYNSLSFPKYFLFPKFDGTARTTYGLITTDLGRASFCYDFDLGPAMVISQTNNFYNNLILGTPSRTVQIKGDKFFTTGVNMVGDVTLTGNWRVFGGLTHTKGTLTLGSNTITFPSYNANNSNTRAFNMGSGNIYVTGTGTVWDVTTTTNLTLTPGTSTMYLTDTTATGRTFTGGRDIVYPKLVIGGPSGNSSTSLNSTGTFAEISTTKTNVTHTLSFGSNIITVAAWTFQGTTGYYATLSGSSLAAPGILILSTAGPIIRDYMTITGIRAYPITTTWYAGLNSLNAGSIGWIFTTGATIIAATILETATGTDTILPRLVFLGQVTETATASDVIAAIRAFYSSVSEAASAYDAVAAKQTARATIQESAYASDFIAAYATFVAQIQETTTATGVVSALAAFNRYIAESATASELVAAGVAFNRAISEGASISDAAAVAASTFNAAVTATAAVSDVASAKSTIATSVTDTATASDSDLARMVLSGVFLDSATGSDQSAARAVFAPLIADTASITDSLTAPGSVYNPPVVESASATVAPYASAAFQSSLTELANVSDAYIGAYLWNLIDDEQSPEWGSINSAQTPGWGSIDSAQSAGWGSINSAQSAGWSVVDDSQDPDWQNINNI